MTILPRAAGLRVLVLTFLAGAAAPASAQDSSDWVQGFNSRVRLISGGVQNGRHLAGIEIVLDQGFKTYWRHPGESGLPPRFEWTGSRNLAGVDLKWPAPSRTKDAGGIAYSYSERVIFPLVVAATDPKKPVRLQVRAEYGVCKDICIPARAEFALTLNKTGLYGPTIEQALARVPREQALAAAGPLSVLKVEPKPGEKPSLSVDVRFPSGSKPSLFVEAPDNWFLSASGEPQEQKPDEGRFTVTIDELPKDASGSIPLRFTLVAGEQAVETELRLDASALPR
jgi:DsbC/DsbD-like thiol-disulfide interchange protein